MMGFYAFILCLFMIALYGQNYFGHATIREERSIECAGMFRCDSGHCVPASARCNGNLDCDKLSFNDYSDEQWCQYSDVCAGMQWQCATGRCIHQAWVCDGHNNCGDGSDEERCGSTSACPRRHRRCRNGKCVLKSLRCDMINQCGDYSDERRCRYNQTCSSYHWKCRSGQCVFKAHRCNGVRNCMDRSDEKKCKKSRG